MKFACLLFTVCYWTAVFGGQNETEKRSSSISEGELVTTADGEDVKKTPDLNSIMAKINELNVMREEYMKSQRDESSGARGAERRQGITDAQEKERIALFESKMEEAKQQTTEAAETVIERINEDYPDDKDKKKREKLIAGVTKNVEKVNNGIDRSMKAYPELESKATTKQKLAEFYTNLKDADNNERGVQTIGVFSSAIGEISTLIDPEVSWQERTAAGFNLATSLAELLPSPIGDLGAALFGFIAACFGAAAPTTDEFKSLRNQILNGMKDLMDETQKAEAMGCIYKIEFLNGILEVHDSNVMTDQEFYAIILAGGIDVGVSALGTFKYKMEQYRDKNTIADGRRSLEMAHFYSKVAEARDVLHEQIINFIGLSGQKSGITTRFFKNTQALAKQDYQHLFWWEDECCGKSDTHFSALLAFNLPISKHAGKGKTVDELQQFIKRYRTKEYYENEYYGLNEDVILTYDKTVAGKYEMVERPVPVDTNYHKYKNFKSTSYYLGCANWYAYFKKGSSNYKSELVCDAYNDKKVWNFGVDNEVSTFRYIPSKEKRLGEPTVGQIDLKCKNYDYFVGSSKSIEKFADRYKLYTTWKTPNQKNHEKDLKNRWATYYAPGGGMIASCFKGRISKGKYKGEFYHKIIDWESLLGHSKMRMFKVKLSTWEKPMFLVSPGSEYNGDKVLIFNDDSGHANVVEVPKPAEDADDTPLTAASLKEDPWNKVWFIQES